MTCRLFLALALLGAVACAPDDSDALRGRRLDIATLPAAQQARVYQAALRTAFQLNDPNLRLLADPRLLPRTHGLEGGDALPDSVMSALRAQRIVQGSCAPDIGGSRAMPVCDASGPGYVVRVSEVFDLPGDSVQVYVRVQQYRTATSSAEAALSFERVFKVVPRGGGWEAVREGRMPR